MPIRDSQRSACYRWAEKHLKSLRAEKLSPSATTELIAKACALYNLPSAPSLAYGSAKGTFGTAYPPCARHPHGHIILSRPLAGANTETVLHEAAHIIIFHWQARYGKANNYNYFNRDGGHGPYFMAVYLDLLLHFTGHDLRSSCGRLKVAHPLTCQRYDPYTEWWAKAGHYTPAVRATALAAAPALAPAIAPPKPRLAWCSDCNHWHGTTEACIKESDEDY
jgi:hypothetical protein